MAFSNRDTTARQRLARRVTLPGLLVTVPCLFIGGVKVPFGTPEEFAEHTSRIIGAVTHVWLPGGHDPRNCDELIALEVQNWLKSLR